MGLEQAGDASQASGQQIQTAPGENGDLPISNGDGTFTWTDPDDLNLNAAILNGTAIGDVAPVAGQVLTATDDSDASWEFPLGAAIITVTGTPTVGQVLTATSPTAAHWATPA